MESNASAPLRKGQACIYCRRRKMVGHTYCDGARPICGQCRKGNRPDDCEYTDHPGQSRTEALENNIARLQARIYELEHPDASTAAPILLTQPYRHNTERSNVPQEPARDVDKFLEYGSNFGFFLYASKFRASAILPYPMGHHERPSSSLLATVYFLGILFSEDPAWKSDSQNYLAQALQHTSDGLSGTHPQKVLHTIQAEVLLANYFFSAGKLLEGRYHITTAMSLCVGSSLNKIRSPEILLLFGSSDGLFPQAGSPIEVGERIIAWWITLALDQSWAAALEVNSYNDAIIAESETPWPLRIQDYAQVHAYCLLYWLYLVSHY
ncbi:hypothetical protein GYMLUDRAFT_148066 [Collybiopsis luxurians FD-317 M1]|nr:hypothetical protein GYMLUDRAFT_148066 [Collybiopsis luxurians FD-317 M1]